MVRRLVPARVAASITTRQRLPAAWDTGQTGGGCYPDMSPRRPPRMGDKLTLGRASEPQVAVT